MSDGIMLSGPVAAQAPDGGVGGVAGLDGAPGPLTPAAATSCGCVSLVMEQGVLILLSFCCKKLDEWRSL